MSIGGEGEMPNAIPTPPSAMEEARQIAARHCQFHYNGPDQHPCAACYPHATSIARALSERDERLANAARVERNQDRMVYEASHDRDVFMKAHADLKAQLRERERAHNEALDALQATAKDAIRFQDQVKELTREVERLREAVRDLNEWHGRQCGSGQKCEVYKEYAALLPRRPAP